MTPKKYLLSFLAMLAAGFLSLHAGTFDVTQNIVASFPSGCSPATAPFYSAGSSGSIFDVTVYVEHDIVGVGNPSLANTINQQCWRFLNFDVYAVDPNTGQESLETTVEKFDRWLAGAAVPNGSSTNTYSLDAADLAAAGVTDGYKIVRLRVEYRYNIPTPHTLNLSVLKNGALECYIPNVDYVTNSPYECFMGSLGCLNYANCDASLQVTYSVSLGMSGPFSIYPIYNFTSKMTNGVGPFTYEWTVVDNRNEQIVATGSSANFTFHNINLLPITVSLKVTDSNGCTYFWSGSFKKGLNDGFSDALGLTAGPNPVSAGAPLQLRFFLPSADEVALSLYDLGGREVRGSARTLRAVAGENLLEIGTAGLAPGAYLLRLSSPVHGKLSQKVLVK